MTITALHILSLLNGIKSILFPPSCIFCGESVECYNSLCSKCWFSIKFINRNTCKYCGGSISKTIQHKYNLVTSVQTCKQCASLLKRQPEKEQILVSVVYDEFVKELILKFKNGKSIQFAELFAKLFHEEDFFGADFVIPVPIHIKKLYQRTYNQTALLAFALKRLHDWFPHVLFNTLKKTTYPGSQKGKNFQERQENIEGSFSVTKKGANKIKGKIVVVLDDVVASGATLLECKRVLEKAEAKEVRCVALAKSFKNK